MNAWYEQFDWVGFVPCARSWAVFGSNDSTAPTHDAVPDYLSHPQLKPFTGSAALDLETATWVAYAAASRGVRAAVELFISKPAQAPSAAKEKQETQPSRARHLHDGGIEKG